MHLDDTLVYEKTFTKGRDPISNYGFTTSMPTSKINYFF